MSTATTEATVEATEVPTEATEPTPGTEVTHAPTEGEPTEATLVEIPLEQLRTNPLNLRRRVGDIKALTKSIAELGIVVPLIVTPAEDGTYLLAAGERRLTAARAAGLAVAPCVVKNLTEAEQVEIMLTENDDDRTPLSPCERAAGYLRLVSLGCTVRRLAAKVGRSAKHVSTHMALLELPERAQLAVDAGELSMADVAALVKVKDQPELIEEVLALPAWNRHDIAMVIERRIAQRRQEEAYVEAVAEQEAKGRRVIESASVSQSKAKRLRDLGFKVADHQSEPCHAVVVERYLRGVEVVEVCDDPRRHTARAGAASRSELQVTPATVVGQSPEDRERRSERKRVLRRRAEFLAEALARRSVPKPRDATAFCLYSLMEQANGNAWARAGALLGVEPAASRWGGKDWHRPIRELADRSSADLLRVATAMAASCAEERISSYGGYGGGGIRYVEALTSLGYEPDPFEDAEVAAARERVAEEASADGGTAGPDDDATADDGAGPDDEPPAA
jgi:ParB family chromosome partitioning protein